MTAIDPGLPVIGLTAGVSLSEQTEAIGAGMNAVVGKPFDPPVLVRTLWRCLPGLAQRAGVSQKAVVPVNGVPMIERVVALLSPERLAQAKFREIEAINETLRQERRRADETDGTAMSGREVNEFRKKFAL